jgi:Trk K+ transport system NAD-binding subunit
MLSHAVNQRGSAKILDSILSARSQNLYITSHVDGYILNKPFLTVQEELRQFYGILVIGIRDDKQSTINPPDDTVFKEGDSIIYLSQHSIDKPYVTPTVVRETPVSK